ncbi:ATP-dependent DNA ligase [Kineococcus rhizosphaerae]|uniref:DNA ligase n=1 Tax=Kineococcus rhizosphaerae TaxID=559628 RepID=A0A2T0QWP2_9ACTN|nr:ATP-dependent DNA ligase [Kineococcus rhizosphaerae]PRY09792.1 DNA ligase-1 [Kineococcus rhizosphaerae]
MLLADVVTTSAAVASTRARTRKVAEIAQLLGRLGAADGTSDRELAAVVAAYLGGSLPQRRTGLGWRSLASLPAPADAPSLTVRGVHERFEAIAALGGAGSRGRREEAVRDLFAAATADEQRWLRGVVTGELRQGALDALVQDAAAQVAGVPAQDVRRAAMLAGSTVEAVVAALHGGAGALAGFGLQVGRPLLPMLASSATTVAEALEGLAGPVAVDTKLDGIRVQVHRRDGGVLIATRTLEDLTARLPEVVDVVAALPGGDLVLDGEALTLDEAGRPKAFQDTASRTAQATGTAVVPFFFDVLHADGADLLDTPLAERLEVLDALVPQRYRVPRLVTADPVRANEFAEHAVAGGHEGVVVKDLASTYAAGRRGGAWVKVKPVHTLDLVVLAVERGSGRRSQWLSNIHLGARDPATGGFVMLGKTFKGMTDEVLRWQTQRFRELAVDDSGYVVTVRPEQVVEIAFDGLQRSTRYPGGLALRFARVVRYREDKTAEEADTIETVRGIASGRSRPAG